MFYFNKGTIPSLKEQKRQLEALLGMTIREWSGKTQEEVDEEWALGRIRRFYQQEWRIRWDGKSERVVFHTHDAWIHKRIHAKYLQTLGSQGVEEAKRIVQGFIRDMEPTIQGGMTLVNAYVATFEQMDNATAQQLSLFANPEADELAQ
jgi:hypothetical protein